MKRLKSIFSALYFTYLGISILLFIFQNSLNKWMDPDFLERFINFWLILGFVFFVTVWIIQAIQINFLKKDIQEMETKILELKGKLYDFGRTPETEKPKKPDTLDSPQ